MTNIENMHCTTGTLVQLEILRNKRDEDTTLEETITIEPFPGTSNM
jgi:hypothetical protein